jgi:TatD DNase family protein
VIDSHCHLAGREFAADLEAVVSRAVSAGIARCLVILASEDDDEFERADRLAPMWPDVRFAIGVHPHQAHQFAEDPDAAAALTARRLDTAPRVSAIGEIGLDYHYDFSPRDVQHAVFRAHLRLARERGLPVVIHTREAETDTLRLIEEESQGTLRGVFHCFSGSSEQAARALETGFHVSIPGIVTFPKAAALREAAQAIPEDRLLIETDSPYLAPVPFRGRRNEPAYVLRVFECLASIRGAEAGALASRLIGNFDELFASASNLREEPSVTNPREEPS